MHATTEDNPTPTCTPWCPGHDTAGWDVHTAAVTRTCRRVIECDGGVEITLERFASLTGRTVDVDPPTIRVDCTDALSMRVAAAMAATLGRAAEMLAAPSLAA
jgi:hypothetical protein